MSSTKYSEAGKGSAPRKNADTDSYNKNYSAVFGTNGWLERKRQQELQHKLEKKTPDPML